MQNIKILKRQPKPVNNDQPAQSSNSNYATPSIEEREELYQQAKARIFKPTEQTVIVQTLPEEQPTQKAEYWFREDEVTDPE